VTRALIIVQNLPVPFDRRVWLECQALTRVGYRVTVICPRGKDDPRYEVVDGVELYKYRPYAPGGSKLSFVAEYAYSFTATAWKALLGVQPAGHLLAASDRLQDPGSDQVRVRPSRPESRTL
jgi:hypothetical protein